MEGSRESREEVRRGNAKGKYCDEEWRVKTGKLYGFLLLLLVASAGGGGGDLSDNRCFERQVI